MGCAWVLIDDTNGTPTQSGQKVTLDALAHLAEACSWYLNGPIAAEWGGSGTVRVGTSTTDVQPGERAFRFVASFPAEDAGASAYHEDGAGGVPDAFCAVTTCSDLYGPNGLGVDASHEIAETAADPGCNRLLDDFRGTLHALEICDPVEVQTFSFTCADGTVVQLSNFILQSWCDPQGAEPFDYMSAALLPGAARPPGPMLTAPSPGGQGNYQSTEVAPGSANQIFAHELASAGKILFSPRIEGCPRKPGKVYHWSSRVMRRQRNRHRLTVATSG